VSTNPEEAIVDFDPDDTAHYLEGVDYPASKEDLASAAEGNGAPEELVERLRTLGRPTFSGPGEVVAELESSPTSGWACDRGELSLLLPRRNENPEFGSGFIFFVGNVTLLIRYAGSTILTDPNSLHAGDHAHLGYGLTSAPALGSETILGSVMIYSLSVSRGLGGYIQDYLAYSATFFH
jgi:hypothetical protein